MARRPYEVVIPRQPDDLNKLGKNIISKHNADKASSPISAATANLLNEKLAEADNQYTLQKDLERTRELLNEERNLILGIHPTQVSTTEGTALFYLTSIRNFLLGHFRGSERKLGDWGFTVNTPKGKVQVEIPRNADKLTQLVADVLKKHEADGEASLIAVFDMAALKTLNESAAQKLSAAAAANRNKEKATQSRNLALGIDKGQTSKTPGTVSYIIRSVRDILLGIHRGKEQQLGDWGFEVNFNANGGGGTPPAPPPTPPAT